MKHNRWLKYGWGTAAVLLLFASCMRDGVPGDGDTLPEGNYPLALTAEMDGMKTRAGKDAWTDGDEIGVRIGADGATGRYKLNADGTVKEAVTPVYWQNSASATVTAWWPCEAKTNISISNQSNGYAAYDFLTATAENQNYQTPVTLNFEHQMAKVKYILRAGNGITEDKLATATVSIYGNTQVSFIQGVLSGSDNGWITPSVSASATEGEVLLVPQDGKGQPFIKITISDKGDFTYTPKTTENIGNLEAGKAYTYTITVSAYGIEVKEVTGGTWSDGGSEAVISKVTVTYTADEVKPGDYIYTDGTTSDGGLRARKPDGTVEWAGLKPTPQTGKTVSGIVFWTPKETDYTTGVRQTPASLTDDKIMATDFPDCTRGLAVSLVDVTNDYWQNKIERVASTFQTSDNFTHEHKSEFVSIASSTTATSAYNYIYGYQNTQVLLAYNAYCKNTKGKEGNIVNPVDALETFSEEHPAPANSAGWFIPSVKELYILCCKDEDNINGGTRKVENKDIVNNSLTVANGSQLAGNYWTSLERRISDAVFFLDFSTGKVQSITRNSIKYRVRAVCAF